MTIKTTTTIEVTGEELVLIRSALCDRLIKETLRANKVQGECAEKGLDDTTSWIYMEQHDAIENLIDTIDGK